MRCVKKHTKTDGTRVRRKHGTIAITTDMYGDTTADGKTPKADTNMTKLQSANMVDIKTHIRWLDITPTHSESTDANLIYRGANFLLRRK